jgi:hypothetical protein
MKFYIERAKQNIKNKVGSKKRKRKKDWWSGGGALEVGVVGRGCNGGAERGNPSRRERIALAASGSDIEAH